MEMTVKESVMVKPMEETPSGPLWLSSLDLFFPATYHVRYVYFFRSNGAPNLFDTGPLKAALSRALVHFYPFAGRLSKDDSGRLQINCNAQGIPFLEAQCDAAMDDLGGFTPSSNLNTLAPTVDYSQHFSTFPLFMVKLTRFRCGGVSLGIANEHHVSDGISAHHFINTWSAIARGGGALSGFPPSLDRRVLSPRIPPRPRFPHIEHHPPPPLITPLEDSNDGTTSSTFELSREQINALRQQCTNYSTYEVVAGHVWRCASMARGLPREQETKLQFLVNARHKLRPPLPRGYLGNGVFYTAALALCGELQSNPLSFAAGKVHEAIARMDDEYLRSAVDYMELHRGALVLSEDNYKCPNLGITNWMRLPFYEEDFGWGNPVFVGLAPPPTEGKAYFITDPQKEGCILVSITLHKHHMKRFHSLLYQDSCLISKI